MEAAEKQTCMGFSNYDAHIDDMEFFPSMSERGRACGCDFARFAFLKTQVRVCLSNISPMPSMSSSLHQNTILIGFIPSPRPSNAQNT